MPCAAANPEAGLLLTCGVGLYDLAGLATQVPADLADLIKPVAVDLAGLVRWLMQVPK